ncbi:hypothetical protein SH2C18_52150 [Clostridium sediminicola]
MAMDYCNVDWINIYNLHSTIVNVASKYDEVIYIDNEKFKIEEIAEELILIPCYFFYSVKLTTIEQFSIVNLKTYIY